ncbi:MAG: hypothetical protein ACRDL1_02710 [Solirubrobacterales bacterium]
MKRILVPLALVVALALPVQAAAGTRHYSGAVDPAGTVDFDVKKKRKQGKGKVKKVKDFAFLQVPINCVTGAATTSGHLNFGMKIEQGRFKASGIFGGSNLRVKGTVSGGGSTGTIRVFGNVPLDDESVGVDCDTGVLDWSAARA